MKAPDIPSNENQRLTALENSGVLHTPAEERFDRITRLAKHLFEVPIALISLVDQDTQWFKSCQGLVVSETSREISFCGHALLKDEVFVVEDTLETEMFLDNPLVTSDPSIRFYAGQPIAFQGHRLGTLCLIDQNPREMNIEELDCLKSLAAWVETELLMWRNSRNNFLLDILEQADRKKLIDPVTGDLNESGLSLVQTSFAAEDRDTHPIQIKVDIVNLLDKNASDNIRQWTRKEFALTIRRHLNGQGIMGGTETGSFTVVLQRDAELELSEFLEELNEDLQATKKRLATSQFEPLFEITVAD